ncbi:MAG: extracellular solute-binding protein [Marmoricola sp.]
MAAIVSTRERAPLGDRGRSNGATDRDGVGGGVGGSGATRRRCLAGALVALLAASLTTACTPDGQAPPQQQVAGPVIVRFSVYGSPSVVRTYQRIAADFSQTHRAISVSVRAYPDHDAALAGTRRRIAAGHGPSLFLADRSDLDALVAEGLTMPVDELLGERHVDFGDGYARNALEAFSDEAALQCMPTQLSPLVVYYNPELVDLTSAQGRDGDPITPEDGWTFEQFARAARQAAQHQTAGVWVAPDLDQLAPFVESAGGDVADDVEDPRSVTLSSAAGTEALRRVRALLRRPGVAPGAAALEQRDALARFEDGDLAMLLGYRDLTPALRKQAGLRFDVLPFPELRTKATGGRMQGVCLTRTPSTTVADAAADFLAYLVSDGPAALLARTGAVLPTNLDVEASAAFVQPGEQPASAEVFTDQVRRIHLLPAGPRWEPVADLVDHRLADLFTPPWPGPLGSRLQALDAAATRLLTPPSPSSGPSGTASGGPSPADPSSAG